MSIPVSAPKSDGDFKSLEPGTYAAVCDQVVNIGVQKIEFQDEIKNVEQVYLRFEVPAERLDYIDKQGNSQNRPMIIGLTCTNSLHEKAKLRHYLESWRGRAFTDEELENFDLTNILGKACLLTVIHRVSQRGKSYAAISGIAPLMKGMEVPKAENKLIGYHPVFAPESEPELADWLKEKLAARVVPLPEKTAPDDFKDSDIPF